MSLDEIRAMLAANIEREGAWAAIVLGSIHIVDEAKRPEHFERLYRERDERIDRHGLPPREFARAELLGWAAHYAELKPHMLPATRTVWKRMVVDGVGVS